MPHILSTPKNKVILPRPRIAETKEKDSIEDLIFQLGKVTLEIENLNKTKQQILDKLSNF